MVMETAPASSEARAPKITREKRSRPDSSVPNQCARDGGLRMAVQLCWAGSYGAIRGAKIAISTNRTMTTRPRIALLRFNRRRHARAPGLSSANSTRGALRTAMGSAPEPGIDEHVGDVGQQV